MKEGAVSKKNTQNNKKKNTSTGTLESVPKVSFMRGGLVGKGNIF